MVRKLMPFLVLFSLVAFSFPTDIPYTIEGLLNKLDQSIDKVKNPNFSKTYTPPSLVPYATSKVDGHFVYFHMNIYRPCPYPRPRLGYRSVVIYTPVPFYYPPIAYPPTVVYQPAPDYLDLFLLKELLNAKDEVKETKKEVEKLKEKVEKLEGKVICPTCKREMEPNWTFCPYDGTPLKKEAEKRRASLYAEVLKRIYKEAKAGNKFIAVDLTSLDGLSDEGKQAVLNQLKKETQCPNVFSFAEVKDDGEKFLIDEKGRIVGTKNGALLFLVVQEYKEDRAKLKAVCWLSPNEIFFASYEAKFFDGSWHLTELRET
ncbi:hypothetical protein H5T88_09700 [bacterium]|nr:hypothetical protein [bacterium]